MNEQIDCHQSPNDAIGAAASELFSVHNEIWKALYDKDSFGYEDYAGCRAASQNLFAVLDEDERVQAFRLRMTKMPTRLQDYPPLVEAEERVIRALKALAPLPT